MQIHWSRRCSRGASMGKQDCQRLGGNGTKGRHGRGQECFHDNLCAKIARQAWCSCVQVGPQYGGKGERFPVKVERKIKVSVLSLVCSVDNFGSGRRGCRCSGILDHPTHGCPPHHAVHTLIDKTSVLTPLLQVAMLSSLAHPARSRLLAGVCAELTHSHAEAACNMANSGHATTACVAFENNPK
eukprot:scaffold32564_cov18-Tisochrysis_lutea.AAC.1